MDYGICSLSIVPVRATAAHSAELVTQLLFGETYTILEQQESWLKIELTHDHYTGWIDLKQHTTLTESQFSVYLNESLLFLQNTFAACTNPETNYTANITLGTPLPFYSDFTTKIGADLFKLDQNNIQTIAGPATVELIINTAFLYLNTPYLWGGRTLFGIDCSGFVQQVFRMLGINLPRDAYQQATCGIAIDGLESAIPADLAFFVNTSGKVVHVGLLLPENKIIHAHGLVRIDQLDTTGIYNHNTGRYSHYLHSIRRVIV